MNEERKLMDMDPVADPGVWREIEVDASPEAVWEQIATDVGRDLWLEPNPERELLVTEAEPPERIVWWWSHQQEPSRRVELILVAIPSGTRVIVIETAPTVPLTMLARACSRTLVLA